MRLRSVPTAARHRAARALLVVSLALASILVTPGCQPDPKTTTGAVQAQAPEQFETPSRLHGVAVDRLDDPSQPSMPLEKALAMTGMKISLPDASIVGRPVKVVLNETVTDPTGSGRVGLMVLYETGVKLIIEPGAVDLAERNESLAGALPFRDGRVLPYELSTAGGTAVLVGHPGIQYQGEAEIATEASVMWNKGDALYWLRAPSPSAAIAGQSRAGVGVQELLLIVETMAGSR